MNFNRLTYEEKVIIALKRKNLTWQNAADELGISAGYLRDLVAGNRNSNKYLDKLNNMLSITDVYM